VNNTFDLSALDYGGGVSLLYSYNATSSMCGFFFFNKKKKK
jgi:hypothetical protein